MAWAGHLVGLGLVRRGDGSESLEKRNQWPPSVSVPGLDGLRKLFLFDDVRRAARRFVVQLAAPWEEGFGRLLNYVERNGHARVPVAFTVGGYQLGNWVWEQRSNHAKGGLDAERQHRLAELPGWTWDPEDGWWDEGFGRLLDYVQRNTDARVPQSYEDDDGYRLGTWVTIQRVSRADSRLDDARAQRLEELPGWAWDPLADHAAYTADTSGDGAASASPRVRP